MLTMVLFEIMLVVLLVVGTVLTEIESFGWATFVLLATVVGAQLLHVVPLLQWVSTHLLLTGIYTLCYLAIGVAWSFIKWFSFLMGFRDAYRAQKEKWLAANNITIPKSLLTSEQNKAFKMWLENQRYIEYKGLDLWKKPSAAKNKGRIVAWMALFPCSMIGTLLNDPVRRLFNWLFASFKALYQLMVDAVFSNDKELQ
jgi:hypothetical protein